jgi:hypothetical protein
MHPLALKAEIILALQLVSRHRAPRFASLLALAVIALLRAQAGPAAGTGVRERMILLTAGILAAAAASRVLARGGPYSSARRTAAAWPLVPAARLAGAMLFTSLPGMVAVAVLLTDKWSVGEAGRLVAILLLASGAIAATVMAVTPVWGASGAAAAGLFAVLAGGVSPSYVRQVLEPAPVLRFFALGLWKGLPLPWRAVHWLESGGFADPLVLLAWIVAGVGVSGLLVSRPLSFTTRPP